jgi:hypothetical protein
MTTIGDLAHEVRAKNAGPFWMTLEIFARDAGAFARTAFVDEEVIARLYDVDPATIRLFRIPSLNVVKISFPRPTAQGTVHDRDIHAGQHHVPLALLALPD